MFPPPNENSWCRTLSPHVLNGPILNDDNWVTRNQLCDSFIHLLSMTSFDHIYPALASYTRLHKTMISVSLTSKQRSWSVEKNKMKNNWVKLNSSLLSKLFWLLCKILWYNYKFWVYYTDPFKSFLSFNFLPHVPCPFALLQIEHTTSSYVCMHTNP